jgi:predicted dehydrogenase
MALDISKGLSVGVLGTGRMGRLHLNALANIRKTGVVMDGESWPVKFGVYGRTPAKVDECVRDYAPDFALLDVDELIERSDVVDNCLVNSLHYGPLSSAIGLGKHCFTDKPLAMDAAEAESLLAAARDAGVRHGIVQNMRFQAGPARLKEMIEQGDLGRIFHARVVFGYFVGPETSNRPAWFYRKEESGGGIVHDMMAHFFDLLRYMLGPVERLHCEMVTAFPEREDAEGTRFPSEVEDAAAVTMRFRSGVIADVFASWARRKHEEVPFFEVDGEKGSVACSFNELLFQDASRTADFSYDPTRVQRGFDEGWESVPLQPEDPFEVQLRGFLEALVSGSAYRPDWEDAVVTHRMIEAAYESARTGSAVDVRSVYAGASDGAA